MTTAEDKQTGDRDGLSPREDTIAAPRVPALRPVAPVPVAKRRLWLWAAVGLLGLALAGFVYSQFWMAQPTQVAVEIAAPAPVTRVLAVNGRIAAVRSVDVTSAVTGRLVAIPVVEGELVEADQVLAQIDAAAQNALVRQAMAALDAALVVKQQASEAYERARALGANVAKAVLEADAYAVQSATQEVARLTAVLEQARITLETFTIRAPVAGTILEIEAEAGQIVGPSTRLLTLTDLSDLLVEADVDEAYATQIAAGQQAVLQLAGETGTQTGHVSYVSNRVDEATGGLAIKISFDSPVVAPVGLTVATNIIVDQRAAALSVPRTALLANADVASVFVVVDGVADLRPVTVVDWPAARLIVTSGLAEGEAVIIDATDIADGQAVVVDQP
ncbi:efflux RND transporter periplasmic adaptor subunit [Pseudooceanicola sp.]|uniref:efflux RND transporter periplasmic adaptor subunit n=1 Tax=Pseudooceanicola sp. TaxID=1914328 RepID=UPI002609AF91|nr:efflux RND transporter periplasmic adaptor subunit [Pseudooceanicola sp.]MDF1855887.1 efflux RND transporter periplasmic adaptor subunit [Pseudooceanicola sp.]